MASTLKPYEAIAAKKKAQQFDKIPESWRIAAKHENALNVMDVPLTCGLLTETEIEITSKYDATALLEKLKSRVWSVEQVTVAFCKRAAIAHQLINCLTEIFFDDAIKRAKQLDQEWNSQSPTKPLPPLFGLPISLKDSFQVSGYDTSTGLACYVDEPAKQNSPLAAMLIDLGAVLYCKTNLPQSIMTADSQNNVFGRTLNPRNKLFTAGGSTGGEGALIALRGSVLGVGTDIGGSTRVPAVCNGIYGFRPSVGLIPHGGVRSLLHPGTGGVLSAVGPMATSLRDCALFLETILQAEPYKYDSSVVSIPWTDLKPKRKLRIGIVQDDGLFTPSPPVRRALKQAADLLSKSDDTEVVTIEFPNVPEIYQDFLQYMALDGGDYYREQFGRTGEPLIPSLEICGLLSVPGTTLEGYFDLNHRRAQAMETYRELFGRNHLDVVLMPPAPHTAVPLDKWNKPYYTCLANYFDQPAIVLPVGEVQDTDVTDSLTNAKFGPIDEQVYSLYTGPEQYKGLPVCIQVVGYRQRDEALVKAAAVIDSIIGKPNGQ
ncbi:putative fatty-acid amide hydrolase [Xylariaceae sp. FL1019]|nr:putative fatty-acid amide hydrolase [Xylariaceae sp. FL1019]